MQLRISRFIGGVATVVAAFAIGLASAVPASASVITTAWNAFNYGRYSVMSGMCDVQLQTSRVSADTPAYVSAYAAQADTPYVCTAMLERSGNGGKTWSQVGATLTLPPAHLPKGRYLSDLVVSQATYDGPGWRARACVRTSKTPLKCTLALSMPAGKGVPASPALPASFFRAFIGVDNCGAQLNSTTFNKQRGSAADVVFQAKAGPCTGWLEVSANKGKTWRSLSPRVAFAPNTANPLVLAYLRPQPDGTGLVARACFVSPPDARVWCSVAW